MSGDYSRFVFDPAHDYNGVQLQQGRPLTDWDWNDQVAESNRRQQAGTLDTFAGKAVVPVTTPDGFLLSFDGGGNLVIGRGRIYVDGLLAENHGLEPLAWDPMLAEQYGTEPIPYLSQPYFPSAPALPVSGGPHTVYVDVWEREVTQYEAPDLLEKALGVDTTTRIQTVWQVKVLENPNDVSIDCTTDLNDIPGWTALTAPSGARLTTATATYGSDNPCLIPPAGGYTGLENQLYRVEIHDGGLPGVATFKWSRENGSVETRINAIENGVTLYVDSVGKDDVLRFNDGDWVEITDDWLELNGLPGPMRRIATDGVNTATRTITLAVSLPSGLFPVDAQNEVDAKRHTRIKRWDQSGTIILTDTSTNTTTNVDVDAGLGPIQVPASGAVTVTLESGIVVSFDIDASGDPFRSGDYWMFAARTVDASIELLDKAPPRGIHHHYARLGFISPPNTVQPCPLNWPDPQPTEGDSCACSVCVSPEQHNSGALTIQMAVNSILATGGVVCLVTGIYILSDAVKIDGAKTLHLRGQGDATQLIARASGAFAIDGGGDIALEDFSIVHEGTTQGFAAIQAADCQGLRIERVMVAIQGEVNPKSKQPAAAIALAGQLAEIRICGNWFATPVGILSATGDEKNVLSIGFNDLLIENNLFQSDVSAITLRLTDSVAAQGLFTSAMGVPVRLRIRGNRIFKCVRQAIEIAVDDSGFDGSVHVIDNRLEVGGDGIVVSAANVRVCDNELVQRLREDSEVLSTYIGIHLALAEAAGTAVERLKFYGDGHVLANRVTGFSGCAIATEKSFEQLQIKQNQIEQCAQGIAVAGCETLAVENNQLSDIRGERIKSAASAMQVISGIALLGVVRSALVIDNSLHRIAVGSDLENVLILGICAQVGDHIQITGNEIFDLGPRGGLKGSVVGILVAGPFGDVDVSGNRVGVKVARNVEDALRFGIVVFDVSEKTVLEGKNVAIATDVKSVVTASKPRTKLQKSVATAAAEALDTGSMRVAVSGNQVKNSGSAEAVFVFGVDECGCANNQAERNLNRGEHPCVALQAQTLIVTTNRVISGSKEMAVELLAGAERFTVVGNATDAPIRVNNGAIPAPWKALNILVP